MSEGRVIHHRQVVKPPAGAREDWRIICDLAARLGAGDKFPYQSTHDIFEELRIASKGGVADYAGITWERIDREMGVFWPCPSLDHPGTPRLYEGVAIRSSRRQGALSAGRLAPGGGRARRRVPNRADDGARRVAVSVGHADAPDRRPRRSVSAAAMRDPSAAGGVARRRRRRLRPRREPARGGRRPRAGGEDHPAGHRLRALSLAAGPVCEQLHDPRDRSDLEDSRVQDLRGARIEGDRAVRRASPGSSPRPEASGERARVLHRLLALHRLPGVRAGVRRMRHAPRALADPSRDDRAPRQRADRAAGLHALRGSDLRAGLPRRRHQADAGRRRPELARSRAASAARTACSPARSACRSTRATPTR